MESKVDVIFLDAKVLFSMAYSGQEKSRSYLLVELKKAGIIGLVTSHIALEEAIRNLELKKPSALKILKNILDSVKILQDIPIENVECNNIYSLPLDDRFIFATAVWYKVDYFLTGNIRDFQHMMNKVICGVKVMKPADFLYSKS